jgi:type I restriction enzyme S subunit
MVLYGGHTRRAKLVDRPFVAGPNVKLLEPGPELDAAFLFRYLEQLQIKSRGYADHFPDVRRHRVPLPPVPEQRRIAEILNKADALRAKRRAVLARLHILTQSIFLEMFGEPATNPKGWPVKALDALGNITTGKTPPTKNEGMFGGEIPFATPGDLDVDLEFTQRTITTAGAAFTKVVRAGSALVGCIGNVGKMAKTPVATALNQQINAVEWGQDVDDDYGIEVLFFAVPQMLALASSTTVPILNKSGFSKVRIPVPPLAIQRDFSLRRSAVRRLRLVHRAALVLTDRLFGSLQHRAFRGEL